jgi:dipeptidyl aminopeptidase/acylaminoacyl peptidase
MRAPIRARCNRVILAAFLALPLALPQFVSAQSATGFGIDDVLSTANVGVADVSRDGRWAVITTTTLKDRLGVDNGRYGDPTYVSPSLAAISIVDTRTGESRPLFPAHRQARGFSWSPDGSKLVFALREGEAWRVVMWERERNRMRDIALPAGRIIDDGTSFEWSADGARFLFTMRTSEWQKQAHERFLQETESPVVVNSSEDPFLNWEAIRRLSLQEIPALYDVANSRITELMPEGEIASVDMTADASTLVFQRDITKKTDYTEIFGRESELLLRPVSGGEPKTLMKSTKGATFRWSGDGRSFVYAKEGRTFFGSVDGGEPRHLTGLEAAKPAEGEAPKDSATVKAERERRAKERFTPVRLDEKGDWMIATNREGFWLIDTKTGTNRKMFLAVPQREDDNDEAEADTTPRYSVVAWSRDGNDIYLSYASRTQWERGIMRYDVQADRMRDLVRDGRNYSGITLSDDGRSMVLSIANGNQPGDVYAADSELRDIRRLTNANPGIAGKVGRTRLIDYMDADGHPLKGVLYYPLNYVEGTKVPTIFILYEDYFDDRYNSTIALLTSNGYAVVQPSVDLERGYPGESWIKGVTAAANKLIDMGIADPKKLGVHGTSYGGYATNLLVTQTDRFAAAINISGKVDMISFYTDSPRLGTRNIHAPERSQDRIGATLWEQPQKYIQHSAIMFADRVDTPLLLMTGHEDPNVPERTTMEMFYALRRLGKRVEWVSYTYGGHGMPTTSETVVRDYHKRILDWYERYLKNGGKDRVTQE